ncbi:MAG: DUF1697 domain-containing protein [Candidatus Omnitrophica bacterium]|nr:DUF1697 domain-containing protein [Candidatus Omnitrophota bacterium]
MKYVALLRGINVGGNRKVEMNRLKTLFQDSGHKNVTTYINSGNVLFESGDKKGAVLKNIERILKKEFKFDIPILVKTQRAMKKIADAIPKDWKNDANQKSDVAYLFEEIDSRKILQKLPFRKDYIDVRYVKGAIYWNIERKNYNKSQLNKIIGHELYQFMTVRNVNTARFLAENR